MSTEENKARVRRSYEEVNRHNWAGIEKLHAPGYVLHGAPLGMSPDLAGLRQFLTAFWTAFPDLHIATEDLIAEGDKVASRFTLRATHQGEFLGLPPTGKQVSLTAIEIHRIEDDKVVEGWGNYDTLGLLQQLGAIPQMAQGGA